jgi:hypothetical protein
VQRLLLSSRKSPLNPAVSSHSVLLAATNKVVQFADAPKFSLDGLDSNKAVLLNERFLLLPTTLGINHNPKRKQILGQIHRRDRKHFDAATGNETP